MPEHISFKRINPIRVVPGPFSIIDRVMMVDPLNPDFPGPGPESFASINLGPETIPEIWITVKTRFGPEVLDYLNSFPTHSKNLISIFHPPSSTFYEYIYIDYTVDAWLADYWNIVEYHGLLNWDGDDHALAETYVNNELIYSNDDTNDWEVQLVKLGQTSSGGSVGKYVPYPYYFDDFYIGTTRGARDIFSSNFNIGNFHAWTSTEGLVSIIDNPF